MFDLGSFTVEYAEKAINEFVDLYKQFKVVKYKISEYEQVIVVEDSAILFIKVDTKCEFIDVEENSESATIN